MNGAGPGRAGCCGSCSCLISVGSDPIGSQDEIGKSIHQPQTEWHTPNRKFRGPDFEGQHRNEELCIVGNQLNSHEQSRVGCFLSSEQKREGLETGQAAFPEILTDSEAPPLAEYYAQQGNRSLKKNQQATAKQVRCKKPRATLTSADAVEIYRRSLHRAPRSLRPASQWASAAALARRARVRSEREGHPRHLDRPHLGRGHPPPRLTPRAADSLAQGAVPRPAGQRAGAAQGSRGPL